MEDKPNELSKIEREMKRLIARMEAESIALNKILKVLEPRNKDEGIILQNDNDKKDNEINPNKQNKP